MLSLVYNRRAASRSICSNRNRNFSRAPFVRHGKILPIKSLNEDKSNQGSSEEKEKEKGETDTSNPEEKPKKAEDKPSGPLISDIYKQPGDRQDLPDFRAFELQRVVELLVQYGGTFGTAAVVIGLLTKIDPFGDFHWDPNAIQLSLLIFMPSLLLDLVYMLPDYSSSPEEAKDTMRLFIKPELLSRLQEAQAKMKAESIALDPASTDAPADMTNKTNNSTSEAIIPSSTALISSNKPQALDDSKETLMSGGGELYVSVSAIAEAPPLTPFEARKRKIKLALEMLQEFYIRNNPTSTVRPITELLIILVSCLADEMLYRAVFLTLVSYWIRDRLYEGGLYDVITVTGGIQLDALQVGQWSALALGVAGGAFAFALRAFREMAIVEKAQEIAKQYAEEKQKEKRPKALPGWEKPQVKPKPSKTLPPELLAEVAAQLGGSMGSLNSTVWTLEGCREVVQVTASGSAFILTGNLAAPYIGSVLTQIVMSTLQRVLFDRKLKRRRAQQKMILEKRRAAAAVAAVKALEDHDRSMQDVENAKPLDSEPNVSKAEDTLEAEASPSEKVTSKNEGGE